MSTTNAARLGLALIVLSGFLASSCTTVTDQRELGPEGSWEYTVLKGTRTGRQTSRLMYRGRTVGAYFSVITIGDKRFEFEIAADPTDLAGYRLSSDQPPAIGSGPPMTEDDIKRDWYLAPRDGLRSGTPEHWVWVKRENLEAWVNPRDLYRLANRYDLAPILKGRDAGARISVGIGVTTSVAF